MTSSPGFVPYDLEPGAFRISEIDVIATDEDEPVEIPFREAIRGLLFSKFIFAQNDPVGGAWILKSYYSEITHFSTQEKSQFAHEFLKLAFSEDEDGKAFFAMAVIHDGGKDISEPIHFLSQYHPEFKIRTKLGEARKETSAAGTSNTIGIKEFETELLESLSSGSEETFKPVADISLSGEAFRTATDHFPKYLRQLENNQFLRPSLPWGDLSVHQSVVSWTESSAAAAPLLSVHPHPPTSNLSDHDDVPSWKNYAHANFSNENTVFNAAATAGVTKPIGRAGGEKCKTVLAFSASSYEEVIDILNMDITKPPGMQCNVWVTPRKLNSMIRQRGVLSAQVNLFSNDIYFSPRLVIMQLNTLRPISTIAWHVHLKQYKSTQDPPTLHPQLSDDKIVNDISHADLVIDLNNFSRIEDSEKYCSTINVPALKLISGSNVLTISALSDTNKPTSTNKKRKLSPDITEGGTKTDYPVKKSCRSLSSENEFDLMKSQKYDNMSRKSTAIRESRRPPTHPSDPLQKSPVIKRMSTNQESMKSRSKKPRHSVEDQIKSDLKSGLATNSENISLQTSDTLNKEDEDTSTSFPISIPTHLIIPSSKMKLKADSKSGRKSETRSRYVKSCADLDEYEMSVSSHIHSNNIDIKKIPKDVHEVVESLLIQVESLNQKFRSIPRPSHSSNQTPAKKYRHSGSGTTKSAKTTEHRNSEAPNRKSEYREHKSKSSRDGDRKLEKQHSSSPIIKDATGRKDPHPLFTRPKFGSEDQPKSTKSSKSAILPTDIEVVEKADIKLNSAVPCGFPVSGSQQKQFETKMASFKIPRKKNPDQAKLLAYSPILKRPSTETDNDTSPSSSKTKKSVRFTLPVGHRDKEGSRKKLVERDLPKKLLTDPELIDKEMKAKEAKEKEAQDKIEKKKLSLGDPSQLFFPDNIKLV